MGRLTTGEREVASAILVLLAVLGIAMAAVGGAETFGVHGVIILFYSLGLLFYIISRSFALPLTLREPPDTMTIPSR